MSVTNAPRKLTVSTKNVLHYLIMIALMVIFYFIPSGNVVTPYGMRLLGVFIGLVYGWTFLGLLVPSIIGCFGLAFAGFGSLEAVSLALFGNITVLLMIFGSLAFDSLRQTNASDWMFAKILSSKIAQKNPIYTVTAIFTLVLILGALGMGILLQFVLFPVMSEFLKKCGYAKGEKFSVLFLIGYMMACLFPIGIFPFHSWGLMVCGSLQSIAQYQLPMGEYILASVIVYILFLITYPLLMKLVGCDFSKLANVDVVEAFNVKKDAKLDIAQKFSLFGLLIFIGVVIVCSFAPIPLFKAAYAKFTVAGFMMIYWVVMLIVRVDDKPILDIRQAAGFMYWDLCILMAVALVLSSALTSPESGISTFIAMKLGPILAQFGQITFIMVLAIVLIILTNLANNIAVVFILLNIVASLHLNGLEINLLATSIILAIGSCAVAFLTPASSMPGALIHGAPMINPKDVYFWNCILMVYEFILLMLVCIPIVLLGIGA